MGKNIIIISFILILSVSLMGCSKSRKKLTTSDEYTNRALEEMAEKDYAHADIDFLSALALKSDNVVALFGYTQVKRIQKDYRVAIKFLQWEFN